MDTPWNLQPPITIYGHPEVLQVCISSSWESYPSLQFQTSLNPLISLNLGSFIIIISIGNLKLWNSYKMWPTLLIKWLNYNSSHRESGLALKSPSKMMSDSTDWKSSVYMGSTSIVLILPLQMVSLNLVKRGKFPTSAWDGKWWHWWLQLGFCAVASNQETDLNFSDMFFPPAFSY